MTNDQQNNQRGNRIIFSDVVNPTGIDENNVIQHELLEWQRKGAGYILTTRMEHSKEYIQRCKQQILHDQKIVQRIDELIKLYSDIDSEEAKYNLAILKDLQRTSRRES